VLLEKYNKMNSGIVWPRNRSPTTISHWKLPQAVFHV